MILGNDSFIKIFNEGFVTRLIYMYSSQFDMDLEVSNSMHLAFAWQYVTGYKLQL